MNIDSISKSFIELVKFELAKEGKAVNQRTLAKEIGVSRSMIQWAMNGQKNLSKKVISAYAAEHSLTFDQLLHCLEESQLMTRTLKVIGNRLNVVLSEADRKIAERLKVETQAESLTHVVRKALNVYAAIVDNMKIAS